MVNLDYNQHDISFSKHPVTCPENTTQMLLDNTSETGRSSKIKSLSQGHVLNNAVRHLRFCIFIYFSYPAIQESPVVLCHVTVASISGRKDLFINLFPFFSLSERYTLWSKDRH